MINLSLNINSQSHAQMIDITARIRGIIKNAGVDEGICVIYVPHTTAGITINESADPDVATDIVSALDRLVPWQCGYRHMEGNAAAHIKAGLMGTSVHIAISDGRLILGTWQGIFFCEFDGPRARKVNIHLMSSNG